MVVEAVLGSERSQLGTAAVRRIRGRRDAVDRMRGS
jgi:hypothetical protein